MAKFGLLPDIRATLVNWVTALKNLSIENVKGYEWEGSFDAGEIVSITHPLKVVPTRFIITDCFLSSTPVIRPDTPAATAQYFYLTSASNFSGKVLILP